MMQVVLLSYGRKHGDAPPHDIGFSADKLLNPYVVPSLRVLPGTDPKIKQWLRRDLRTVALVSKIVETVQQAEGVHPLRIVVGCWGGKHRSVVVVEMVAERLRERGFQPIVGHRDLTR